jgi:hypothetical protein
MKQQFSKVFDVEWRRWRKEYISVTREVDDGKPEEWIKKMAWNHFEQLPSLSCRKGVMQ